MAASYSNVRVALSFIPPDMPREDWWQIGAAIKSEFGEGGFELFDNWSQGGSYDEKAVRATWKSTKDAGGIKIGTLFKMAQDNGYRPRREAAGAVTRQALPKPQGKPTGAAQAYWDRAEKCISHPYAETKNLDIAGDGLKKYKGKLLIPAFNAAGKISSIQEIGKDSDKKFLQGCSMSGCWYTLPGDDVLVVAEGWATAKSIHLATGHTAIVAFSSGGFLNVPPLLRKKYPEARIILAPDNDESQDAVKKATQAARKDSCEIIVPEVTDGSDFDDVRQEAGLDEIRHQFNRNAKKPRSHDLMVVKLKNVIPRAVEWLWPGKFAIGKLVLLGGVPSTGKTTITHSIISIVSNGGQWPFSNDRAKRGRAAILTAEDDIDDTIVPRLMAAEADLSRVDVIQSVAGQVKERPKSFLLADDSHQLRGYLKDNPDTRLVVFDPLSAYLGASDAHRDADVRQVLGPLAQLAADHHITVLGITHLTKDEGKSAMTRFLGSTGIIAAARSAYLTVSVDNELMMLPVKNNLAPRKDSTGLTYNIRSAVIDDGIVTSAVEWTGESEMWADEALAKVASSKRAPKLKEAKQFLTKLLTKGPKRQKDIEEEAEKQGYSLATMRRAKHDLDYQTKKESYGGGWKWYTPAQWENHQKVLKNSKNKVVNFPKKQSESNKDDHLREANEKPQDTQDQEFDHLGPNNGTSFNPKPASDKVFAEGDQVTQKSTQKDQVKNSKKTPEDAKVIKPSGSGTSSDDDIDGDGWGAIE